MQVCSVFKNPIKMIKKVICASGAVAVAACGPAQPKLNPSTLSASQVSLRVEGGVLSEAQLFSKYVAKSDECNYVPRAFGLIPQHEPIPSTAFEPLNTIRKSTVEIDALLLKPERDKCAWSVGYLSFDVKVNGRPVLFVPSPTVSSEMYLPKGAVRYVCAREINGFLACEFSKQKNSRIIITLEVK